MIERDETLDDLMREVGVVKLGECPRTAVGRGSAAPDDAGRPVPGVLTPRSFDGVREDPTWCKPGLAAALRQLRKSSVQPEDLLDLHDETVKSAWQKVDLFLGKSVAAGMRVVEIVHGSGQYRSIKGVLKGKVRCWLADCAHVKMYFETRRNPGSVVVQLRTPNNSRK